MHRPIFGGVFGAGRYALATIPCIVRGLHAVRFMVIEPASGAVLSLSQDKAEALDAARSFIRSADLFLVEQATSSGSDPCQLEIWPRREDEHRRPVVDKRRPVSKRRRDIFAKACGRCHYCSVPLVLDGAWHVEHMLPRALGGGDEVGNLVAACVPCNLAKRDRTAIEFVTQGLATGARDG